MNIRFSLIINDDVLGVAEIRFLATLLEAPYRTCNPLDFILINSFICGHVGSRGLSGVSILILNFISHTEQGLEQ